MRGRIFDLTAPGLAPMCRSKPTHRRILTVAALAWVAAFSSLYFVGGCASSKSAKGNAALDAYVQGVLAYQKGDTDKAMANLQDAVSQKDDLVMARSMLGDLYRARSDYDSAREQYEVVARLD